MEAVTKREELLEEIRCSRLELWTEEKSHKETQDFYENCLQNAVAECQSLLTKNTAYQTKIRQLENEKQELCEQLDQLKLRISQITNELERQNKLKKAATAPSSYERDGKYILYKYKQRKLGLPNLFSYYIWYGASGNRSISHEICTTMST